MPKIKFTEAKIKSLKPSTSYVEYYDTRAKHGHGSLGLRVSPAGKKAWFVLYRNNDGKQKRFPMKMDYPKLSLADANKRLLDMDIISGGDPIEAAKMEAQKAIDEAAAKVKAAGEHAARLTMTKLYGMYALHRDGDGKKQKPAISPKTKKPKNERNAREEDRKWRVSLEPEFGDIAIEDMSKKHVNKYLINYAKKSPVAANRLQSLLSIMLTYASKRDLIEINPILGMEKIAVEMPRDRILDNNEIKTLWGLLENEPPNVRDTMKMMLLTAQRKGEIFSIHWRDIDLEEVVWNQKENKTYKPQLVPLSPQAMEIINGRQITDSSGWIFPSVQDDRKHVVDIKKARIRLNKLMGCEDNPWTEHDLRRTARTLLSKVKIEHHIRERVLNHSIDKMEITYDVYDYLDEKRDALVKLADEIDKITGQQPKPQGKIIKMKVA